MPTMSGCELLSTTVNTINEGLGVLKWLQIWFVDLSHQQMYKSHFQQHWNIYKNKKPPQKNQEGGMCLKFPIN